MRQYFTCNILFILSIWAFLGIGSGSRVWAQAPTVVSMQPVRHAAAAPRVEPVTVSFTQAITTSSATNLRVYGSQGRGLLSGRLNGGNTSTLVFSPAQPYAPGERVSVSIPTTLTSTGGVGARRHVYTFTAATAGLGQGFFLDTTEVAPTNSRDQLLGDLDNDGDLDLVTSAGLYGMYSYLNDGQGHFTPHFNSIVGRTPSGATLADINQDGYLDLLAGDTDNATVGIGFGDHAGSFGFLNLAGQLVSVGARPVSVAAGDVDGDGDLDFVSANHWGNSVTVGFNGGATQLFKFTATATVSVGVEPTTVQLADVDNDGDLDILTSNSGSNSVSIRFNNGLGGFSGTTSVAVGGAPSDLDLADLDLDGDLDLLTANATDGTVSVRLNNGLGSFSGTTTFALPPGSTPTGLRTGDVNADGAPDLVVAQGRGGQVITFLNNGAGSLAALYGALELTDKFGLPTSLGVTLGDVDGDGDLDLITADEQRGRVVLGRDGLAPPVGVPTLNAFSPGAGPVGATGIRLAGTNLSSTTGVYFNGVSARFVVNSNSQVVAVVPTGASTGPLRITTVGGSVTSIQPFVVTAGPVPAVLVTATVPQANALNVSATANLQATFASPITNLSAPAMHVFGSQRRGRQLGPINGGNTTTLSLTPNPAFAPGEHVALSLPAGLTGTSGGSVQPRVVEFRVATGGSGEGIFAEAGSTTIPLPTPSGGVRAADLDNDGDLDLISSPEGTGSGTLELRFNDGQGRFSPMTSSLPPALAGTPGEIVPADVDGDGDFDLLVAEGYSDALRIPRISVWYNNGQGRFSPGTPFSVARTATELRVGDLDADGDLDIVFREDNDIVRVALNNGSGTFTLAGMADCPNIYQLRLADLDRDGDLDVLALSSSWQGEQLVTILNDGRGGLTAQTPLRIFLPRSVRDLAVGDLTEDGIPDAVVVAYNYGSTTATLPGMLAIWPGQGKGQFGPRSTPIEVGVYPRAVSLADVNADGHLDILTLAAGGSDGSILPPAELNVQLGDGRGGIHQPNTQILAAQGNLVFSSELGDFDGDGDLDVVYNNRENNALTVRFNQGRPAPTVTSFSPAQGSVGTRVVLSGTNLNSARQVTFGGGAVAAVQVLSSTQCVAIVPAGAVSGSLLVTTPGGTGTSAGSFKVVEPVAATNLSPARNSLRAPTNADVVLRLSQSLNANAAADLIVTSEQRQGRRTGTASGVGTAERRFDPALDFTPGERVQVSLPVPSRLASTTAQPQVYNFTAATGGPGRNNLRWASYAALGGGPTGDFDEDGAPDIVTKEGGGGHLRFLYNDGHGRFGARTTTLANPLIRALKVADINGDAHLDLVMSEYDLSQSITREINRLVWRAGTGTGSFGPAQLLPQVNGRAPDIAIGDLNGDGLPDIMALIRDVDSVMVVLNMGNGVFQRQANVASAPYAMAISLADINNDGMLDLLTSGTGAFFLYRSLGMGNGSFVPQPPLSLGEQQGAAIEVGDVDSDGNSTLR